MISRLATPLSRFVRKLKVLVLPHMKPHLACSNGRLASEPKNIVSLRMKARLAGIMLDEQAM